MSELNLSIEGSSLEKRIADLYDELAARGIQFRPHFWLSDEWFTPDGVPGIAIPFYLAHPRLARLEREQMLEVEGALLVHADPPARGRPRSTTRTAATTPPPPSDVRIVVHRVPRVLYAQAVQRSFVLHIDNWYAQSHPDEDFAETFAVWLNPARSGAAGYQDWPALKKLEYMDELMRQIASQPPLVDKRRTVDPLHRIRRTLRRHYKRKAEHYALDYPDFYDRDLRRLFPQPPEDARTVPASRFINRIRKDVRRTVAAWTGVYQ